MSTSLSAPPASALAGGLSEEAAGDTVARSVADTEMVRRQNRALVLTTVREAGPLSRSAIAARTGLSNATLSAIGADLVAQGILEERDSQAPDSPTRGRPAVLLDHNRTAGYVALIELDVNHARLSLLDFGGALVDRIESVLAPDLFGRTAASEVLGEWIERLRTRNREIAHRLLSVSISLQGILDGRGTTLDWSPIAALAGQPLVAPLQERFGLDVTLYKRGRLMADGVRQFRPDLAGRRTATMFVGSTVGMGLTLPFGDSTVMDLPTEFGHMNHIPGGALCRCGARGCIEAYASDYGILRTAFSVPEHTPPAARVPEHDLHDLVERARAGERSAIHAFNLAGQAVGFGINRLMALFAPDEVVLLGPGTGAYDLMREGIMHGAEDCLVGQVNGAPTISVIPDESEPIYRGLSMKALSRLDRDVFAAQSAAPPRAIAE